MNKKPILVKLLAFAALVITAIAGISLPNINNSLNTGIHCDFTDNICLFKKPSHDLKIEFGQTPIVEEELTIDFTLTDGFKITKIWIEGVNMYMGKIPVIINPKDANKNYNIYNGETFLGSCTQPSMQWRMIIEVGDNKTEQTYAYSASFATQTH